jgi:peptide/nickel transport system permease protein
MVGIGWYLVRRLSLLLPTLLGASIVIFALIRLIPGDFVTIMLGVTAAQNEQSRDALVKAFHLDRPLWVQYIEWMGAAVVKGDLGRSLVTGLSVRSEIVRSFPVTLELVVLSLVLAMVTSIPVGAFTAVRSGRIADAAIRVVSLLLISVPAFLLGLMLLLMISRYLQWMPILRYTSPWEDPARNILTMVPPSLALGAPLFALLLRFVRSGLLETLGCDYVRTARAKGVPERQVVSRHAFRNALVPVLAVVGTQVVQLVGGLVVVETVFALPGVGRLLVEAVRHRDYVMVQGILLVLVGFSMLVNVCLDLLYAYVDPRIAYG